MLKTCISNVSTMQCIGTMTTTYRVFGSAGSPYSIKVRSYFRYKDIDHTWLVRNTPELMEEHSKASKLPIVPTVILPSGVALQDSTPIIEKLEELYPTPSIYPPTPSLRFISALLEVRAYGIRHVAASAIMPCGVAWRGAAQCLHAACARDRSSLTNWPAMHMHSIGPTIDPLRPPYTWGRLIYAPTR